MKRGLTDDYGSNECSKSTCDESVKRLRGSPPPCEIIGRVAEMSRVRSFVENHLQDNGASLYICGTTGTGKTASVSFVVQQVTKGREDTVVVMLNGSTFGVPVHIYAAIADRIGGFNGTKNDAKEFLTSVFSKGKSKYLVVVDEIDQLLVGGVNNRQNILYQLLEWANRPGSRLVLIGIANAIDLHDRFLPNVKQYGFEPEILVFSAYNKDELKAILTFHLEKERGEYTFDDFGVELVARKIAAKSGDVRKGLDICKQALVTASSKPNDKKDVSFGHISSVLKTLFDSPHVQSIQSLPQQAQYALIGMVRPSRFHQQQQKLTIANAFNEYKRMMRDFKLPCVSMNDYITSLLERLEQDSLLTLGKAGPRKGKNERSIQLNCELDDIKFALEEESPIFTKLLSGKDNRDSVNFYAPAR